MEIKVLSKKSDICWEESMVHRKKNYTNICIYTVYLFLYECITCKVKSCLSNYCTFHISYVTTNTQKYIITSIKKIFLVDILSLLLVRPKIFINIISDVFRCHAPGKKSPWMPHTTKSAVMSSHAAFMASNRDIWSCGLWSTYICSQTWLVTVNGWMVDSNNISIRGHLPI